MEELRSFFAWYRDLCITHPGFAIIAGLFAVASFGWGAFKVVDGLIAAARNFLQKEGRFARPLRIFAFVAATAILIVVVTMPTFVRRAARTKPSITAPRGRVLDQHPVVRWEYSDAQPETRYRLVITDRETGKTYLQCTQQNILPLVVSGRLSLKVAVYAASDRIQDCASINVQTESDDVPLEIFHDSVDRIRHLKTLAYAIHHDASDGLFCYESGGEYLGFDRELIEQIASILKRKYGLDELKLIPYEYSWDQIFQAPHSAQIDAAIASISITKQRQGKYDVLFSQPYWTSELGLIVARASGDSRPFVQYTLDDLKGKRIGFHSSTTAADLVPTLEQSLSGSTSFRPAKDNEELFGMLWNGEVDAVLYDLDRSWSAAPIESKWIPARLDLKAVDYQPEQYGVMFASLNGRLKNDFDEALVEIGKDRIRDLVNRHIETLPGMNGTKIY
jgi:ABC-type amino acid transport substrate-binding protein